MVVVVVVVVVAVVVAVVVVVVVVVDVMLLMDYMSDNPVMNALLLLPLRSFVTVVRMIRSDD